MRRHKLVTVRGTARLIAVAAAVASVYVGTALIAALTGSNIARAELSAAARPECSARLFENRCENQTNAPLDLRKSRTDADGVVFNYFLVDRRERHDEINRLSSKPSQALIDSRLTTAEEIRQQAIAYVSDGQPESSWSPQTLALVTRLRTVRLKVSPRGDAECSFEGDPGIPNATYSDVKHRISICNSTIKIPTVEFANTIAHEFAHTVSPCAMSKPLLKHRNRTREMNACLLSNGSLPTSAAPPETTQNVSYGLERSTDSIEHLVKCQAIQRVEGSKHDAIPAYAAFSACIEKKNGPAYQEWTHSGVLGHFGRDTRRPNAFEQAAIARRIEVPQKCFSKDQEHFADTFGAFVFAKWSTAKNLDEKQIRTALHSRQNLTCAGKIAGLKMSAIYPTFAERLDLAIRPLAMAQHLKCTPSRTDICSLSETTFASRATDPSLDAGPTTPSGEAAPTRAVQ